MHYSNFSRLARVGSSVSLGIDAESSNYDARERRGFVLARRYTGIMDGSLDLRDGSRGTELVLREKWRSTCKYKKVRGLGSWHETRVFPVCGHRGEKNDGWRCLSRTVNVNVYVHYRGIKWFGTVFLNHSRNKNR